MDSPFKTPIPGLYGIQNWGNGYFDVNAAGHLVVKPYRTGAGIEASTISQVPLTSRITPGLIAPTGSAPHR